MSSISATRWPIGCNITRGWRPTFTPCIRNTNCGGNTRLFHGWEGSRLTDKDWKPLGIVMQADARFGESPGGLQAPHVIRHDGTYHMFYGDWCNICLATSRDGKEFERQVRANGKTGMFNEGDGEHARERRERNHGRRCRDQRRHNDC